LVERSLQMVTLALTRLAAGVAGLALSLTGGAVVASADPDLGPVINTTCSYSQVVSALNAQTPAAASQLNASPSAQAALRGFLDSSPDQRRQIIQELESRFPQSQQYIPLYAGFAVQVASTCNNY
jgi:hemophore-related protein